MKGGKHAEDEVVCLACLHREQIVVATRRMFKAQVALLLVLCGSVRMAEAINTELGSRWRSFATQNYFDPRGVFMSVMFSAPVTIIILVLVVWCGTCPSVNGPP